MSDKLTIKQEKYAQGLFAGLTQREAYKQAYDAENMTDKSIDEKACELAANVKVQSRIADLTEDLKYRNMATVENVIAELAKIAFTDSTEFAEVVEKSYFQDVKDEEGNITGQIERKYNIVNITPTNQLDKAKRAAIAGIKTTKDGIEIKTNDKLKAIELLGKTLGIFTDKIETTGNQNLNINFNIPRPKSE